MSDSLEPSSLLEAALVLEYTMNGETKRAMTHHSGQMIIPNYMIGS